MRSSRMNAMVEGHVAGALDSPLVVLLEQDRPDQAGDGGLVGEDAHNLGAALNLAVEAFQGGGNRHDARGAATTGGDRFDRRVWCDQPGCGALGA